MFTLCIFLISESLVLAGQYYGVDAYVTDWTDTNYLVKDVHSDFYPNTNAFYAYYGVSALTLPFSNITRIIVTDRILITSSTNYSEPKYYCFGEIILKNNESLQCSWTPNGWKGVNNFDGEIFIGKNYWKEIKFGGFNNLKKRVGSGKRSAYPYTIHVSSFQNKHVANSVAMKLKKKGIPAFVCPRPNSQQGRISSHFYWVLQNS